MLPLINFEQKKNAIYKYIFQHNVLLNIVHILQHKVKV